MICVGQVGSFSPDWSGRAGIFRAPGALRRKPGQPLAEQINVAQRKANAQPGMVLRDASVAHPVESEDALQDAKRVFYLGSHPRLGPVLSFGCFIDIILSLVLR